MSLSVRGARFVPEPRTTVMGTAAVIAALRPLLREEFGDSRSAAKELAIAADASVEAAKSWLAGKRGMSLANFMRAARGRPRLQRKALEWLGIEHLIDPELVAMVEAAARRAAQLKEKGGIANDR